MTFDIKSRTILLTLAGSHAYGISRPDSDIDCKGIAIPPKEYYFGMLLNFEQADKPEHVHQFIQYFTETEQEVISRTKLEGSIYELRKFIKLAMDANPNILDALFCRDEDVRYQTAVGEKLRANKNLFISAKAKHTLAGYSWAQVERIKTHRQYILNPIEHKPTRKEFDLPEHTLILADQLATAEAQIKKKMDSWEFDFNMLPESDRLHISGRITDFLSEIMETTDSKWKCAARSLGYETNFLSALEQERRYKSAFAQWHQYQHWKTTRNKDRSALEEKYLYDTKHGAHLYRLMTMCREVLTTGQFNVYRGDIDAQKILDIRNGAWSFEKLIDWAEQEDKNLQAIYAAKAYNIPKEPDRKKIQELCVDLVEWALQSPEKAFAKV